MPATTRVNEFDSEDGFQSANSEIDSDEELQLAFERKELKPGLNVLLPVIERQPINDVPALKQRLVDLMLQLPWLERLDMVNLLAPLAPELVPHLGSSTVEVAEDDFKREVSFYRQAQAAVLEAIPKLNAMGVRTKRPDDYFAQMAKTDEHMTKVRQSLLSQKLAIERREKAKKLREMRKYGKSVQQEVIEKKSKDKRDFIAATNRLRKGQSDKFDNLVDDAGGVTGGGSTKRGKPDNRQMKQNGKRPQAKNETNKQFKDKKFGFGGKKKNTKYNDAKSSADAFRTPTKGKASKMHGKKGGKGKQKGSRRK